MRMGRWVDPLFQSYLLVGGFGLALRNDRFNPGNVATQQFESARLFQLTASVVGDADADFPDANRVVSSATHPNSFQLIR
jgi:hypothetical protein